MDLDFDSQNDYRIFGHTLRLKVIEVMKSIVVMRPIEIFGWLVNRIQITFNVRPSTENLDGKQKINA
jgi:hypothetical protein